MLFPQINHSLNSPVIFGALLLRKIFTLTELPLKLVSDISYLIVIVDPRIDFESREG